MRPIVVVLVSLTLLAFVVTGCGGQPEASSTPPTRSPPTRRRQAALRPQPRRPPPHREPRQGEPRPEPQPGRSRTWSSSVLPSLVNVRVQLGEGGGFLEDLIGGGGEGEGSGVVIDSNGTILTNNHVVQDAESVSIVFADGQHAELPGRVLGTAPERDLAVVCVDATDLKAIEIGSSARPAPRRRRRRPRLPARARRPDRDARHRLRPRPRARAARRRAAQEHDSDRRRHQPRKLRRPARRQRGQADRDQHGGRARRVRRERRLRDRDRRGDARRRRRSCRATPAAAPAAAAPSRSRAPRASPSRPSRRASSSPVRSSLPPRSSRRPASSLRPRRVARPGSEPASPTPATAPSSRRSCPAVPPTRPASWQETSSSAVDGQPVSSGEDLVNAISGHQPGDHVTLELADGRTVDVELGERPTSS